MLSENKIFPVLLLFVIKGGQSSQLYPSPFIQHLPLSAPAIPHALPFSHAPLIGPTLPGTLLPHSLPFAQSVPFLPHSLPAIAPPPLVSHHIQPAIAPLGALPPFAHGLPLAHHAIPIAPPTIAYKHSVPYNVPPFVKELHVFNKLIAPAPIIAAPAVHHAFAPNIVPQFAPNIAPIVAQNLVHRPVISPFPSSLHTSYFSSG